MGDITLSSILFDKNSLWGGLNIHLFDKNSLWGGLNIQKGELCVKGFLSQHLGVGWGLLQQGFGGIWGWIWGGDVFNPSARLLGPF